MNRRTVTNSLLLHNVKLITPTRTIIGGWLLITDGKIASLGTDLAAAPSSTAVIDARHLSAMPGFIDLHVHGAGGRECMDGTVDALRTMSDFYARHGVTSFLATTWTAPRENIQIALQAIATLQNTPLKGATILGAHLEGPFLNPDRCGAQDRRQIRTASTKEALALLDVGVIRLLALAPEFPENHWLISECQRRGITVSAAHTAATYAHMQHAISLGLTQTTHTFNAMTALNHREPGTVGAALDFPELNCELIADNVHVHPAAMRILFALKGLDRTILISDAVRGAGLPAGTSYEQDGRIVTISHTSATLADGTLAGSILTMDRALQNFAQAVRRPFEELWQVSSWNAARAIHVSDRKGSLEIGKDADIVLLDSSGTVHYTLVEGRVVYQKELST